MRTRLGPRVRLFHCGADLPSLTTAPMRTVLFVVLATFFAPTVSAQENGDEGGRLVVFVRDAETRLPFEGARVEVAGTSAATGETGRVLFRGVEGTTGVRVSAVGRNSVDTTVAVVSSGLTRLDVDLTLSTSELGEVSVESESLNERMLRRRGFYERQERRSGEFVTREELDQRGATQFRDVFSGVPGVRVTQQGTATVLVSNRRRDCPMAIFIDGVEAAFLAQQIENVPFDPIAAVEIYKGPAEVPPEYSYTRRQQTCGAVLVWTRIEAGEE